MLAVTGSLNYLYTRLKFNWTEADYTVFSAAGTLASSVATIAIVPVLSLGLRLPDTMIGVVCALSGVTSQLIFAFAANWWMMYIGELDRGLYLLSGTQ